MSTKIQNGFIANVSNMSKIQSLNDSIEAVLRIAQRKALVNKIAQQCLSYYEDFIPEQMKDINKFSEENVSIYNFLSDFDNRNGFNFFLKQHYTHKTPLFRGLYEVCDIASKNNIPCEYNMNVTLYFKTLGKRTLYYIMADQEVVNEFRKQNKQLNLLKDFEYYSSEAPDGITERQWSSRGRTWDNVLGEHNSYNDAMYAKNIQYKFYLNTETLFSEICEALPDEKSRYLTLYKKLKSEEFYNLMEKPKTNSPSDFMSLYMKSTRKVRELFKDGNIPEDYEVFKEHFISQRDMINKIENVNIKFN